MASSDNFERGDGGPIWSYHCRRGFDDAYAGNGYHPPPPPYSPGAEVSREREDYDLGFENGGYTLLEEAYPGISEATALMHTDGKSSQEEIISWLLAPVEQKYCQDQCGHLAGYELDGRTIYG